MTPDGASVRLRPHLGIARDGGEESAPIYTPTAPSARALRGAARFASASL